MSLQPARNAPARMNWSKCRSCGAQVQWYVTKRGKPMPLDPEERSDGNVVIEDGKAVVLAHGSLYTGPRYVSHFATCTEAGKWRRRR